MSLKISNLRLGLDQPEATLPDLLAHRLGVGRDAIGRWRILRKSLDARQHDDIHFVYSAEVETEEEVAIAPRSGIEAYEEDRFDWPEVGEEPLRHRPVIIGAGRRGCSRRISWRRTDMRRSSWNAAGT